MERSRRHQAYRRTLAIAIGVSVGVHLVALAWIKLNVPTFAEGEKSRALQLVELPDEWADAAIEVVPLETAVASAPSGAASGSSAASAPAALPDAGAGGADAASAALAPVSGPAGAASNAPALTLAPAEAAPIAQVTLARSNRGVIRRASSGGAAGESGFDFIATSDAARDAERERGGDGRGGLGGPGISIMGGGDGHCPTWGGIPFVGPTSGLGGIPTGGKGRGVIGARPPGGEAINRFGPRLGGGR